MTTRPRKPCTYPGCGALTDGRSSRCAKHPYPPRPAWKGTSTEKGKRMTGRALQAAREALFRRQPLCVECARSGVVRLATVRDHIVPLAEDGEDVESNTQGLCGDCHDAKSEAERLRGVRRRFGK